MTPTSLSKIVSSFTVYKFLEALTTPFRSMRAYLTGVIDEHGNVLVDEVDMTPMQRASFSEFDRIIVFMKKIITKVPDPYIRSSMANVTSALRLLSEECEKVGGDKEYFMEIATREIKACRLFEEGEGGGPANAMGGNFATTNAPPGAENPAGNLSGYDPPLIQNRKLIFKRRKPNKYNNEDTNKY
jgi:hypothetical protein